MTFYNFSWTWFEDYSPHWLSHAESKTEEEFKEDCIKALQVSVDDYLKQEKIWAGMDELVGYAIGKMKSYGYELICPITFDVFGGCIVDEEDKDIEKLIGKENFEKMIKHNEKIEAKLYGD